MQYTTTSIIVVVCLIAYSQESSSPAVELVVESAATGAGTKIHAIDFTDTQGLRAVVTHERQTSVAQLGDDQNSIRFLAQILPHNAARIAGDKLVALAPMQAEI